MTRWFFLSAVLLVCSQFYLVQQPGKNSEAALAALSTYEQHKQAAIRINELAGRIRSEADANAVVSEIAAVFAKELPPAWVVSDIRQRVAHAEYDSVSSPANLISEQRVVDAWNQYAREIGAPDEAIVTVAEIHNLRDAEFTAARYLWARGSQTIWTVPKIYAVGTDGEVAEGCRAIEAIRVIYDLYRFQNLIGARDRRRMGIVASEQAKKRMEESIRQSQSGVLLVAHGDENPVRSAEVRYLREHGSAAYDHLRTRLFAELFPSE
jgi:hypothetical protein